MSTLRAYTVVVLTTRSGVRRELISSLSVNRSCALVVCAENRLPELLVCAQTCLLGVPRTLPSLQVDSMTVSGGTQFYVHLAKI